MFAQIMNGFKEGRAHLARAAIGSRESRNDRFHVEGKAFSCYNIGKSGVPHKSQNIMEVNDEGNGYKRKS